MKLTIVTALCLTTFASCGFFQSKWNGDDGISGGPCSYDSVIYPAVIIEIASVSDEQFEISCRLDAFDTIDTISYYVNRGHYVDNSVIEANSFAVGDTLIYEHRSIVKGACNPDIYSLKLERFNRDTPNKD